MVECIIGRTDHEWIPFGFKVYNTDKYGNPTFIRTEDIRCLYCGEVKPVRGERSLQNDNKEPRDD